MSVTGLLEGKVALVTGAASGMGAAQARLFVEQGARVVSADIDHRWSVRGATPPTRL